MKNFLLLFLLLALVAGSSFAQMPNFVFDSTLNNLVHVPGYKAGVYGSIPDYVKRGKGDQTLVLIPGWGFSASVFEDFMKENEDNYTMYAISLPGYGTTNAPPMPDSGTSYGKQYWNTGAMKGILDLFQKENIIRPVVVGNFVQGAQIALRLAIDYPTLVRGVIVIGAPAKFIPVGRGDLKEFTLQKRIAAIDSYMGPKWFKSITKKSFDDGNYLPELYSLDSVRAQQLWKQSASIALPVMVRYLCEFFAGDITLEAYKLQCPTLIVRGMFNKEVLDKPINNYVKAQFIDSWDEMKAQNPLVKTADIENAGCFTWKDKPEETYQEIKIFTEALSKGRE